MSDAAVELPPDRMDAAFDETGGRRRLRRSGRGGIPFPASDVCEWDRKRAENWQGRRESPVSGPFISGRFLSYLFSVTPWLPVKGWRRETEKVWRKNIPFPERNTITGIERFF
jgi:hypothetical protein